MSETPEPAQAAKPAGSPESDRPEGPSQPPMWIIFGVLSVAGYSGTDSWWGVIPHLIAIGLLAVGLRESLSRKSFEQILKNHPRETFGHYRVNCLMGMVIFPGLVWLLLGFPFLVMWFRR